jgi:hypothetical protein
MVGLLLAIGLICDCIDYYFGDGLAFGELGTILPLIIVDDDSWWPMYNAAKAYLFDEGIYQSAFIQDRMKFQYPPLSILPFVYFIERGWSWEEIREFMNTISYVSLFLIMIFVYKIATIIFNNYLRKERLDWKYQASIFILAVIGTLGFDAIIRGQYLGQVQVLLDLITALAFLMFLTSRKFVSGVCIALASLVKPQFSLIFFWALIRKEKDIMLGMLAVFIPAGILSLYYFGFDEHLRYIETLSLMGRHGEFYWPNQSVNGLIHRLISDVDPLVFPVSSYAPYHPVIYAITLSTTVIFICLGLFYRPEKTLLASDRKSSLAPLFDLATMFLLVTMASPIAWYHHYGILWPFFIAAFAVISGLLYSHCSGSVVVSSLLLIGGFLLLSNRFPFLINEQFATAPVNILLSHYLLGAFLTLSAMLMIRHNLVVQSKSGELGV